MTHVNGVIDSSRKRNGGGGGMCRQEVEELNAFKCRVVAVVKFFGHLFMILHISEHDRSNGS